MKFTRFKVLLLLQVCVIYVTASFWWTFGNKMNCGACKFHQFFGSIFKDKMSHCPQFIYYYCYTTLSAFISVLLIFFWSIFFFSWIEALWLYWCPFSPVLSGALSCYLSSGNGYLPNQQNILFLYPTVYFVFSYLELFYNL